MTMSWGFEILFKVDMIFVRQYNLQKIELKVNMIFVKQYNLQKIEHMSSGTVGYPFFGKKNCNLYSQDF